MCRAELYVIMYLIYVCVDGVWGGFLLCRIRLVCRIHIVCVALCSLWQGAVLCVCLRSVAQIFRLLSLKLGMPCSG